MREQEAESVVVGLAGRCIGSEMVTSVRHVRRRRGADVPVVDWQASVQFQKRRVKAMLTDERKRKIGTSPHLLRLQCETNEFSWDNLRASGGRYVVGHLDWHGTSSGIGTIFIPGVVLDR